MYYGSTLLKDQVKICGCKFTTKNSLCEWWTYLYYEDKIIVFDKYWIWMYEIQEWLLEISTLCQHYVFSEASKWFWS